MEDCYIEIRRILKKFPPSKNENKFIYGKLIEKSIITHINKIISCTNLDNNHKYGSEYKNDCLLLNTLYSIKAQKQKSDVILINKHNKQIHSITNMYFI